jgi:hypothetical protein
MANLPFVVQGSEARVASAVLGRGESGGHEDEMTLHPHFEVGSASRLFGDHSRIGAAAHHANEHPRARRLGCIRPRARSRRVRRRPQPHPHGGRHRVSGWDPTTSSLVAEVEMREEPELGIRRDKKGIHALGRLENGRCGSW